MITRITDTDFFLKIGLFSILLLLSTYSFHRAENQQFIINEILQANI